MLKHGLGILRPWKVDSWVLGKGRDCYTHTQLWKPHSISSATFCPLEAMHTEGRGTSDSSFITGLSKNLQKEFKTTMRSFWVS